MSYEVSEHRRSRWAALVFMLYLSGCSGDDDAPKTPAIGATTPSSGSVKVCFDGRSSDAIECKPSCAPDLKIRLTPAPPGETPLERWRRTKADWQQADRAMDAAIDKYRDLSMPALEAYVAAEKELQALKCDKLCEPVNVLPIGSTEAPKP